MVFLTQKFLLSSHGLRFRDPRGKLYPGSGSRGRKAPIPRCGFASLVAAVVDPFILVQFLFTFLPLLNSTLLPPSVGSPGRRRDAGGQGGGAHPRNHGGGRSGRRQEARLGQAGHGRHRQPLHHPLPGRPVDTLL
jgi:hypothetical protein